MRAAFHITRRFTTRLVGNVRGATLTEFGLVVIPFMMLLSGTFDLGYQAYLRSVTAGVLEKAARRAAIGAYSSADTDQFIRDQMKSILPQSQQNNPAAVQITKLNYYNFSGTSGAERITGDTVPLGVYNSTDCYEDRNGNGRYDAAGSGASGQGGADDIVYYQVTVQIPRVFPLYALIGWGSTMTVSAKTLIRNQPYGEQTVVTRCS